MDDPNLHEPTAKITDYTRLLYAFCNLSSELVGPQLHFIFGVGASNFCRSGLQGGWVLQCLRPTQLKWRTEHPTPWLLLTLACRLVFHHNDSCLSNDFHGFLMFSLAIH